MTGTLKLFFNLFIPFGFPFSPYNWFKKIKYLLFFNLRHFNNKFKYYRKNKLLPKIHTFLYPITALIFSFPQTIIQKLG